MAWWWLVLVSGFTSLLGRTGKRRRMPLRSWRNRARARDGDGTRLAPAAFELGEVKFGPWVGGQGR
jgi:hypothetical protein